MRPLRVGTTIAASPKPCMWTPTAARATELATSSLGGAVEDPVAVRELGLGLARDPIHHPHRLGRVVASAIFRGHRRGDALRGDGRRPVPGRGGAGDGPGRARGRARPPLRPLGLQPRRRRSDGRRQLGRRPRSAPHTRSASRRSSPRPAVAAPPGSSPRIGRGRRCWRSRRESRRSAAQPPLRGPVPIQPRVDRAHGPARRLRPARPQTGVAKSGELIAITAGLPQQDLGTNLFEIHRVRGPLGALESATASRVGGPTNTATWRAEWPQGACRFRMFERQKPVVAIRDESQLIGKPTDVAQPRSALLTATKPGSGSASRGRTTN